MPLSYLARHDWEGVAHSVLFIAFGFYGLFGVPSRNVFQALGGTMVIFYVEFIAIGVLLLVSMRINSWALRRTAYIIFSLALAMLAVLLGIVNRSPFALLALAFAVQGMQAVRLLGEQQRVFALAANFRAATKRP